MKKNIVVLGSTGSLGTRTMEMLKKYRRYFNVVGLSAYANKDLLMKQAREFHVPSRALVLASKYFPAKAGEILSKLVTRKDVDIVVNVVAGMAGLKPTIAALKSRKILLQGNKEAIVARGKQIMKLAKKTLIIPLDSEHNAFYEILQRYNQPENKKAPLSQKTNILGFTCSPIKKLILPCSGGPLLHKTKKQLEKITLKDLCRHPKWDMGPKICIESALLINKGFEIIEAHYLFDLPLNKIKVVIHPECLLHGAVEFKNGKTLAYISKPDMREHIENALRRVLNLPPLPREIRPLKKNEFNFEKIPHQKLPGIKIVLDQFKNSPNKMNKFLQNEEKLLALSFISS